MSDRALLDDLIGKLSEMQEHLSMAHLEAAEQSLLRSRIRHLGILAHYVRAKLEGMAESERVAAQGTDQTGPDAATPR